MAAPTEFSSATAASTTTALAGAYPSGWSDGQLLVAAIATRFAVASISSAPSGWTLALNGGGVQPSMWVYWKVAATGDDTSPDWTLSAAGNGSEVVIYAIDGADPTSPINDIDITSVAANVTSTTVPSLTTTVDNCLLYDFLAAASALAQPTAPSPWGINFWQTQGSGPSARAHGAMDILDAGTAGAEGGQTLTHGSAFVTHVAAAIAPVVTDTTPPAAPTGLNATAGVSRIDLTWNANSEGDLAGYNVYRAGVTGGPYTKINSSLVTGTSYADMAVTDSQTYYYVVRALDAIPNESSDSNEDFDTVIAFDPGTGAPNTHIVRTNITNF